PNAPSSSASTASHDQTGRPGQTPGPCFQGCFKSDVTAVLALRLRLGFDERVALGTGVNDPLTDENERDNREGRNGEAAPAEGSGQIVVDYAVEDD
ncbi:hypothetical protein, partial [Streptomyces acidiscabies]|uniref:hypothetical protein n=1 Tax=Streptomyces acidiscabies TaxID=42234 RepID=UPI001C4B0DFE